MQLDGVRGKFEGLVHVSQLRREGRVKDVTEVVKKNDKVKVKVLSFSGSKLSLSMKVRLHMHVAFTGNVCRAYVSYRSPATLLTHMAIHMLLCTWAHRVLCAIEVAHDISTMCCSPSRLGSA